MKIVFHVRIRPIGSVDADNVVVLVFNPDPPLEAKLIATHLKRHNVEDQRAHFAQELLALIFQRVMLLVEIFVEKDHLHKTQMGGIHPVEAVQTVQDTAEERRLVLVLKRRILNPFFVEDQPSQEVSVFIRQSAEIKVWLQPLDVGFHQRGIAMHVLHQYSFLVENAVGYDLVSGGRRASGSGSTRTLGLCPGGHAKAHHRDKNGKTAKRTHTTSKPVTQRFRDLKRVQTQRIY